MTTEMPTARRYRWRQVSATKSDEPGSVLFLCQSHCVSLPEEQPCDRGRYKAGGTLLASSSSLTSTFHLGRVSLRSLNEYARSLVIRSSSKPTMPAVSPRTLPVPSPASGFTSSFPIVPLLVLLAFILAVCCVFVIFREVSCLTRFSRRTQAEDVEVCSACQPPTTPC